MGRLTTVERKLTFVEGKLSIMEAKLLSLRGSSLSSRGSLLSLGGSYFRRGEAYFGRGEAHSDRREAYFGRGQAYFGREEAYFGREEAYFNSMQACPTTRNSLYDNPIDRSRANASVATTESQSDNHGGILESPGPSSGSAPPQLYARVRRHREQRCSREGPPPDSMSPAGPRFRPTEVSPPRETRRRPNVGFSVPW